MEAIKRLLIVQAIGLATFLLLVSVIGPNSEASISPFDFTPTAYAYLPNVAKYPTPTPTATPDACPITSTIPYSSGFAYQWDTDNPVRPAYDHADKNIELRSYTSNTDPSLKRELVDYGSDDPHQPPQFATLFVPYRVPAFVNFYQVHDWFWATPPLSGTRLGPLTHFPVTALGLETTQGEPLHVPKSWYTIGGNPEMEVLVIFADEDTVALRYTREDSSGSQGYTVHVDNICTDPNLLVLYNQLDDPDGPRYEYHGFPYTYDLPTLPEAYPFGTARDTEIVVAVSDSGGFPPTHSCHEWWQIRPGYAGVCPPP